MNEWSPPPHLGFFVANQQQQQTNLSSPKFFLYAGWSGGRKCMFLSRALLQYSSVVKQAFHFISFHSFIKNYLFIYLFIIILFQFLKIM